MSAGRRYVLLDRDGTIIVEKHYLSDPAQVELCDRAAEGLKMLSDSGFGLAIVTNQSGIGRGYFDRERLDEIHARLQALLGACGAVLDGIFVCPHAPADQCRCRKPDVGLALDAAAQLGFDPSTAVVVGDKVSDIEFGRRIGATTVLVRTGYGERYSKNENVRPDFIDDDLYAAARRIIDRAAAPTHREGMPESDAR